MPRVKVEGIGYISFPDSMTPDQIGERLRYEILPRLRGEPIQKPEFEVDEQQQVKVTPWHDQPTTEELEGLSAMDPGTQGQILQHYRGNKDRLWNEAVQKGLSRPLFKDVVDDMIQKMSNSQVRSGTLQEGSRRLGAVQGLYQNPDFQALGKKNSRMAAWLATMAANDNPLVPELFLRAANAKDQPLDYKIEDFDASLMDAASHFLLAISSPERIKVANAGAMSPLGVRKYASATIQDAARKFGMSDEESVALLQQPEIQKILAGAEQGAYGKSLVDGSSLSRLVGVEPLQEEPKPELAPMGQQPVALKTWERGWWHTPLRMYARALATTEQAVRKLSKGEAGSKEGEFLPTMKIPGFGNVNLNEYKGEGEDVPWIEDTATGLLSIVADPVSALSFKFGGALGALPVAARSQALYKTGALLGNKALMRAGQLMHKMGTGFGGLGLYGAAQEAVQDDATFFSVLEEGLKEGVVGMAVGAAALPGGGRVAGESVRRYLARNFAAFNLESLVFGVGSPFMRREMPTLQGIADSYGMIGGMKLLHVIRGPSRRAVAEKKPMSDWSSEELQSAGVLKVMVEEAQKVEALPEKLAEEQAPREVLEEARQILQEAPKIEQQATEAAKEVSRRQRVVEEASKAVEPYLERDGLNWSNDVANVLDHFEQFAINHRWVNPSEPFFSELHEATRELTWEQGLSQARGQLVGRFGEKRWRKFLADEGYSVSREMSLRGFKPPGGSRGERRALAALSRPDIYESPEGPLEMTKAYKIETKILQGERPYQEGPDWFLGADPLTPLEANYARFRESRLRAKLEAMPAEQLEVAAKRFGLAEEVLKERTREVEKIQAEVQAEALDLKAGEEPAAEVAEGTLERRAPARQEKGLAAVERVARGEERRGTQPRQAKPAPEPEAKAERRGEDRRQAEQGPPEGSKERRSMARRLGEEQQEEIRKRLAVEPEEAIERHPVSGLYSGKKANQRLVEIAVEDRKPGKDVDFGLTHKGGDEFGLTIRVGDRVFYAEGDFKNLAGLNAKLGTEDADRPFGAIVKIFEAKVNTELAVTKDLTLEKFQDILEVSAKAADRYIKQQKLEKVAHTKGKRTPGVGMKFLAKEYDPAKHKAPRDLIAEAARELESKKKAESKEMSSRRARLLGSRAQGPEEAPKEPTKRAQRREAASERMLEARTKKILATKMLNNGQIKTRQEIVDSMITDGATIVRAPDGTRRLQRPTGEFLDEKQISKTAMDYAEGKLTASVAPPEAEKPEPAPEIEPERPSIVEAKPEEAPEPTPAEVAKAEEVKAPRFTAAEIVAPHPRGARIGKKFAGSRPDELKRQASEALGRELSEGEAKWIDLTHDAKDGRFAGAMGISAPEDAVAGGPAGLDFARWARNSTAYPQSLRKAISEQIEQALGGMDVPRPEQVRESKPPKKAEPAPSVAARFASTDPARLSMISVLHEKDGTVVSTDGHRLLMVEKAVEPREKDAVLSVSPKGGFGEEMDVSFPNVRQVIPKDAQPMLELSREQAHELAQYLEGIHDANPHRQLGVVGSGNFGLFLRGPDGEPIGMNSSYFVDMLKAFVDLGAPSLKLSGTDTKSAVRWDGLSAEGKKILALTMPIRISETDTVNPANTVDLRTYFESKALGDIPHAPYGKVDPAPEGLGHSAGSAAWDRIYSFPGPIADPGAWKLVRDAVLGNRAVAAFNQGVRWRLLGQEGVEIPQDPIELSPLDAFKNQEDLIRQTPEGSKILDAAFKFKDDTNRVYNERVLAFDNIMRAMKKAGLGKDAWNEIIDGLEGKEVSDKVKPHVEALRGWLDDFQKLARKNKVPVHHLPDYFMHIFNGDYWIKVGNEHGRPFESFNEALVELAKLRKEGKPATLEMDTYIPPFEGQPTSRRGFWRAAAEMKKMLGERLEVIGANVGDAELEAMIAEMGKEMDVGEFGAALREGKVLKQLPRHRFFANMMRRTANNPYFSRDLSQVFPMYAYGLTRKITQDAMMRSVQTQLEAMPREHSELKRYISDYYMPAVLGHPTKFEKAAASWFGRTFMGKPIEPYAVRRAMSSVAGVQFVFDLGYSLSFLAVNSTQPWQNLHSTVGERSMLHGERQYLRSAKDPAILDEVRQMAVTEQVAPLTGRAIRHGAKELVNPLGVATVTEFKNRVVSYYAGKDHAARALKGLKPKDLAAKMRKLADTLAPTGTAKEKQLGKLYDMAAEVEAMVAKSQAKRPVMHPRTAQALGRRVDAFAKWYGKQASDRTQFRVGRENLPRILNEAPIKAVFPYKTFLLNQLSLSYKYLKLHPEYKGGPLLDTRSWRRAGIWEDPVRWTRHAAMTFAIGGVMGSPFLLGTFHILNAIYRKLTGEDLRPELRKLGFDRGLLSKLGLDVSGNFAVHMPNPNTFFEDTAGRLTKVAWKAVSSKVDDGDWDVFEKREIQRALMPSQVRRIVDAYQQYTSGEIVSPIRKELIDTMPEDQGERMFAALRTAFGAQDPRIGRAYEDRDRLYKRQEKFTNKRADINERLAAAKKADDTKAIDSVMDDLYNGLVESMDRLDKAKSDESFAEALSDFTFWYQTMELSGESFPNALERKFLPKDIRDFGDYPTYLRYEALQAQEARE